MRFNVLTKQDYEDVHALMLQEDFPSTPPQFYQAVFSFDKAHLYGMRAESGALVAVILFFLTDDGVACVDGVCHKAYRGKWANRATVKQILHIAFVHLGMACLWTESHQHRALNLTKALGFKTVCETAHGTLSVLTPQTLNKKWKDYTYGITF